jgi:hypothetical protein
MMMMATVTIAMKMAISFYVSHAAKVSSWL